VRHPEAGKVESLASRISEGLIVVGSRFPRLLCTCSVRELFFGVPLLVLFHVKRGAKVCPQQLLCRKKLPNIRVKGPVEGWNAFSRTFYTHLLAL
jgi:hypothetical protein